MTISYYSEVDTDEMTVATIHKLCKELDAERYDWTLGKDSLIISGEVEIDDYGCSAEDVADEINWIVYVTTGLSVTASAYVVESEPDWDKMPGGYDYGSWN